MGDSPLNRAPFEIWERILLEVIASIPAPVLDVSCTSSNCLAFKRTCGDGDATAYRHPYYASEKDRRTMRLVCRAWKTIADRWDTKERWMRFSSLDKEVSDERWRGVQRVEFVSPSGMGIWDGSASKAHEGGKLRAVLFSWKLLGVEGGYGMRLKRLEMLHITPHGFPGVIKALCDASTALSCLRSLSLSVPVGTGWPLRMLSRHFPELSHLTLRVITAAPKEESEDGGDDDDDDEDGDSTISSGDATEDRWKWNGHRSDALLLQKLEVLFLLPVKGCFTLSNWVLPALRHINIRPVGERWKDTILPFLERHSSTIETLDLDDSDANGISRGATNSSNFDIRDIDFWDTFSSLKLLRCYLGRPRSARFPNKNHPLECLVNTDPINTANDLITLLEPWVDNYCVKRLRSIVLFGPYMSGQAYRWDKGSVRGIMQQLQWSGIRLLNPAGKAWA